MRLKMLRLWVQIFTSRVLGQRQCTLGGSLVFEYTVESILGVQFCPIHPQWQPGVTNKKAPDNVIDDSNGMLAGIILQK